MNPLKVNKKQYLKWIRALRSGKYDQGYGRLQRGDTYCCLGVACEELIGKYKKRTNDELGALYGSEAIDQPNAPGWLKRLNSALPSTASLSWLNDIEGYTFLDIADLLEDCVIWGVVEYEK